MKRTSLSQQNSSNSKAANKPSQQQLTSIETGYFCTSYNHLVSSITDGRIIPRNTCNIPQHRLATRFFSTDGHGGEKRGIININSGTRTTTSHLEVKAADKKKLLAEVLSDFPRGEEADTLCSITAVSPHISMIVDQAMSLKPGAELFTLLLGPPQAGWAPFGTVNRFEEELQKERNNAEDADKMSTQSVLGFPILMQTAPGIKFLVKVPKADVNVNVPSVFRFLLAHFVDLEQLKAYFESLIGGEVYTEYLLAFKYILEKVSKYLLTPGLDLFVNVNGRLVSLNGEILVRIETNEYDRERDLPNNIYANPASAEFCAIKLKAQIALREILEDVLDIMNYLRNVAIGKDGEGEGVGGDANKEGGSTTNIPEAFLRRSTMSGGISMVAPLSAQNLSNAQQGYRPNSSNLYTPEKGSGSSNAAAGGQQGPPVSGLDRRNSARY